MVAFFKQNSSIRKNSKMHPRTKATLEELRHVKWFRSVGIRDTESAQILSSWQAAIESCSSVEWENICLEAANQYRERLAERSPERFQCWNETVLEVKPAALALVKEKTAEVVEANSLPKSFIDTVNWDILHLCMEAEYADVYPPGYFGSQAYWYLKGHFPCGWDGQFPKGTLIIY